MLGLDSNSWNNIRLLSTAATLVMGVITLVSMYAATQLSKREAKDAKYDLELYKLTVQGQVAEAKREGIEAGKTAGNALVRAAELEKEAARLRLELDREIQKRAQRLLTDEQKEILVSELRGKIPRIHLVIQRDVEAEAYSLQFVIALRDADVIVHPHKMPPGETLAVPAGVLMHRPGGSKTNDDMKDDPLYIALNKAGLFGGTTGGWLSRDAGPDGPKLPSGE